MPNRPGIKNISDAPQAELDAIRAEYLRRLADPDEQDRQITGQLVDIHDGVLCYCAQGLLGAVLIERGYARLRKPTAHERALEIPLMLETKRKGRVYTGSYALDRDLMDDLGLPRHLMSDVAALNDKEEPFSYLHSYLSSRL